MPYKHFIFILDTACTLTFVDEYKVYNGKGTLEMPDEMFRMMPRPLQKQTQ